MYCIVSRVVNCSVLILFVAATSVSCRRQTRATRYVTYIVLYTKMDVQCDKLARELATDDRRHFITLSVHLSLITFATVDM